MNVLERALANIKPTNGTPAAAGQSYTPNPDLRADDAVEVPPFPYADVFPARIQRVIDDCHNFLSYPRDFTATAILSAAAIAIGRTWKLQYQWEETATLYMALVAPPGTAKTHPLLFALHPIIQANKDAIREYNKARKELADNGDADTDKLRDRQCLFGDFTIESLIKAATTNRRGISVYMDELRGFFMNFNRYNSGSEQEFWLSNWSGSPYSVTRMQRKYFLEWLCINIVGTIQPSLLDEIGKGGRAHNGFVERILFCYPDNVPVIMLRKRHQRSDTKYIILKNYIPIIQTLLDAQLAQVGNDNEDDQPNYIYLSPEADDFLTDFLNALKTDMDGHENEYIRNVYSKMQTYTMRFAIILNRLDYACLAQDNTDFPANDDQTVTTDQVARAALLTDYFLKHAMKAHVAISGATPVDKLPRDIQSFYRSLPIGVEITTQELEKIAAKNKGMSRAGLFRMLNESNPDRKLFQKLRHGVYERLY